MSLINRFAKALSSPSGNAVSALSVADYATLVATYPYASNVGKEAYTSGDGQWWTCTAFGWLGRGVNPQAAPLVPALPGLSGYSDYYPLASPRSSGLPLGGWPRMKTISLFRDPAAAALTTVSGTPSLGSDYSDPFSGEGWIASNAAAGGANTNGRSLSLALAANARGRVLPTSIAANAVDVTGHNVYLQLKVIAGTAQANLGDLKVRLYSTATPDGNGANYHEANLNWPNYNTLRIGRWQTLAVPIGRFAAVGTGAALTAITHAGVDITATTAAATVLIGKVFAAPQVLSKGVAVIGFDDCRADTWTDAAKYMIPRGIPGVLYPGAIAAVMRSSADQFQMAMSQITALQKYHGWQIASQAWDTESPTDSLPEFAAKMSAMRSLYEANGWVGGADGSYFSNVSFSSSRDAVFEKSFRTMRSYTIPSTSEMASMVGNVIPFADPQNLHGLGVDTGAHSAADLTGLAGRAATNKTAVIYVFHGVTTAAAAFTGLIDYLDANRGTVDSMTMDQLVFTARAKAFA
jgi:hypothetical protein